MSGQAIQRMVRQSPRKMRLVVDEIRGKDVNEAYAILKFSKKLAARQIEKTLRSAVANAEQLALQNDEAFDLDELQITHAVINAGKTLHRFTLPNSLIALDVLQDLRRQHEKTAVDPTFVRLGFRNQWYST